MQRGGNLSPSYIKIKNKSLPSNRFLEGNGKRCFFGWGKQGEKDETNPTFCSEKRIGNQFRRKAFSFGLKQSGSPSFFFHSFVRFFHFVATSKSNSSAFQWVEKDLFFSVYFLFFTFSILHFVWVKSSWKTNDFTFFYFRKIISTNTPSEREERRSRRPDARFFPSFAFFQRKNKKRKEESIDSVLEFVFLISWNQEPNHENRPKIEA